jgi:hypothetical protein
VYFSSNISKSKKVEGMMSPATTKAATALPKQLRTTKSSGKKANFGVTSAAICE